LGVTTIYRDKKIGVIVPAYNEELLIGDTLSSLPDFIDKVYVIDDCSTDRTADIAKGFEKKDKRINFIRHENNKGVGAAITTGYKRALQDEVDIAAVMAGDNQMDPNILSSFLDPIIDGRADYTKGNRLLSSEHRTGMSKWRLLGNSILTFLTKIASGYWQVMDPQNGYTAISSQALRVISLDEIYPRYGYCNNMLAKMNIHNFKIINVPHIARYGREKSKIRYGDYILKVSHLLMMDFLWRLKVKYVMSEFHPLVLFYLVGSMLSLIGSLGGVYSIYFKFFCGGTIFERGILSLVIFVIGIQFLLFGMLFDMQQENRHAPFTRDYIDAVARLERAKANDGEPSHDGYARSKKDMYSKVNPNKN
jgi:glycosyltransferase involved in cell wall biosynthesis